MARRARLLGPAPAPEAGRGEPGSELPRRRPYRDGRGVGEGGERLRVRQRRHRRVPLPGRRVLLPRDEHTAAGRAPGDRVGHRSRPCRVAAPGGLGRGPRIHPGGRAAQRTRDRGPHQRRKPSRRRVHPLPRDHHPDGGPRRTRSPARRRLRVRRHRQPVLRQPGGQARRLGPRSRGGQAPDAAGHRRDDHRGRRHHHPRRCGHPLRHPDFVAGKHSTNWVEQTLDLSGVTADVDAAGTPRPPRARVAIRPAVLRDVTAEVDGRRYQVKLWVPDLGAAVAVQSAMRPPRRGPAPKRPRPLQRAAARAPSLCRCRARS